MEKDRSDYNLSVNEFLIFYVKELSFMSFIQQIIFSNISNSLIWLVNILNKMKPIYFQSRNAYYVMFPFQVAN